MNLKQAGEIADLINARNHLTMQYSAQSVLKANENYLFEVTELNAVIGCAELKAVQWYQSEVLHLSVKKDFEGKGVGWKLLARAEAKAREAGARLLQCTIREGNQESCRLFDRNGFRLVGEFHNANSGNNVGIWQKIISPKIATF
jgi:ribosomal protein S18 acetylase RimI-like enzyme